tara:strand:- start:434 stop:856 length:423 start_codon:yes stop_codon:yes gene_type:complete
MQLPKILHVTSKVKHADARGPYIRINPKYVKDAGILLRKNEHVRQWYITTFVLFIPYLLCAFAFVSWPWHVAAFIHCSLVYNLATKYIRRARLKSEVLAFRAQLKHDSKHVFHLATVLASSYNLGITTATAIQLLKKEKE